MLNFYLTINKTINKMLFLLLVLCCTSCSLFDDESEKEAFVVEKFLTRMEYGQFNMAKSYLLRNSWDNYDSFVSDIEEVEGNRAEVLVTSTDKIAEHLYHIIMMINGNQKEFHLRGVNIDGCIMLMTNMRGRGKIGRYYFGKIGQSYDVKLYSPVDGSYLETVWYSERGGYILKKRGITQSLVAMEFHHKISPNKADGLYSHYWVNNKHIVRNEANLVEKKDGQPLPTWLLLMDGIGFFMIAVIGIVLLPFIIIASIIASIFTMNFRLLGFMLLIIPFCYFLGIFFFMMGLDELIFDFTKVSILHLWDVYI